MRIIFAGTPEFAVVPLNALIEHHQVIAVFTQPNRRAGRGKKLSASPVKQLAIQKELPIFQPTSLHDQVELIQSLQADLMVVVAYGMILPEPILEIPVYGCINIHASLLPRWRGAAPIQRSIEACDKTTGVSIMQMGVGLDTGPVYATFSTAIEPNDTSQSLHHKLAELGAQGIIETLDKIQTAIENHTTYLPAAQDEEGACYAKKISKSEAQLDWTESANQIQARIRAFNPWPICQSNHQGFCKQATRIRIHQASLAAYPGSLVEAGVIVGIEDDGVIVACGKGHIRLEVLQRDGSKPLTSKLFCNGYSLKIGDHFA